MNLFGRRQATPDPRIDQLETELVKLGAHVRALELEQQAMHDQVRRWMRRAVAAGRNQEPGSDGPAPATPAHGAARPLTGVRARRLSRLMRPDPLAANGHGELTDEAGEG